VNRLFRQSRINQRLLPWKLRICSSLREMVWTQPPSLKWCNYQFNTLINNTPCRFKLHLKLSKYLSHENVFCAPVLLRHGNCLRSDYILFPSNDMFENLKMPTIRTCHLPETSSTSKRTSSECTWYVIISRLVVHYTIDSHAIF
jgi:hypothetical protein